MSPRSPAWRRRNLARTQGLRKFRHCPLAHSMEATTGGKRRSGSLYKPICRDPLLLDAGRHGSAGFVKVFPQWFEQGPDVVLRPPTVKMMARPYVLFKLVVTASSRPERWLQIGKINLAETADSIEQIMAGISQPASSLKQAPARRVTSRSHLSYLHLSFLPAWGIGHDGKTTSTGGIGSSCPTIGGSSATSFANRISRVRFQPSQSALSG